MSIMATEPLEGCLDHSAGSITRISSSRIPTLHLAYTLSWTTSIAVVVRRSFWRRRVSRLRSAHRPMWTSTASLQDRVCCKEDTTFARFQAPIRLGSHCYQLTMKSKLPRATDSYLNTVRTIGIQRRACVAQVIRAISTSAGDKMSALLYASEVMNSHPEAAESYFRLAWSNGDINGLFGLSRILSDRAHASYEDAVEAYAYKNAWFAASLALYDGLSEELFTYQREQLLLEWRELQGSASYPVVLEGTALAREIIVNNRRCCTFQ